MVVLLLDEPAPDGDGDVVLNPGAVCRVASLGVSRISVVGERSTVAIVLEGWAFDPASAPIAADLLGVAGHSRVLHRSFEVAVCEADPRDENAA